MARIWMSGLEAGHMEVFDSHSGAAVSAAQVRTGAYSLYIGGAACHATASFPANIAEVFGRFGMRLAFSASTVLFTLFDSGGSAQATLLLGPNVHTLRYFRGSHLGTLLGRGGCIHKNKWHCIEFRLLVANAGGRFELKVDGTQVIDYTGDTQGTANANIKAFRFGTGVGSVGQFGYYDDIAFNDVAGGANDTWIGRGGIPAVFPTGAGNSTDLAPTAGANWQCVDDVPPNDDADYVFDAVVDEHDSYEIADLPATGTISAVQWLARAKSDLAGAPAIARILRIGVADYQGADIAIDADYDYYSEILDKDPGAGPGAWTVAAINGMEIGVKVR